MNCATNTRHIEDLLLLANYRYVSLLRLAEPDAANG